MLWPAGFGRHVPVCLGPGEDGKEPVVRSRTGPPTTDCRSPRRRGLGVKQPSPKCGALRYPRGMRKHVQFCQGPDSAKPPRVPKARKSAAVAPAPASSNRAIPQSRIPTALVRRDAPTRVLRIVREPGSRVQTVDDVRSKIEQLIQDCQTTLATLAMMDVLSARVPPPAA